MPEKSDTLFVSIGLELGYLTEDQAAECREDQAKLTEMGYSRSLARIAHEKGLLSTEQTRAIRREMLRRGVLPRLGGYELIAKLGEGGMGVVYKARQLSLRRLVALKVLAPDLARNTGYVQRFHREARLAAQLSHPNAVQVFDVGQDGGRHFIVMEYVDGSNLEERLQEGALDERRALAIIRDIAGALHQAHERGIVHRDIKPANILLAADGTAKLSDLGIAKDVSGKMSVSLTRTGGVIGTPHYMSPEQCEGRKDIDRRSDIYSLGITFYHMVTGREPFTGASPLAVMRHHLDTPLPDPASTGAAVSRATIRLIYAMTAKDREQRIADCHALITQVEKALSGEPLDVPEIGFVSAGIEVVDSLPLAARRPGGAWKGLAWAAGGLLLVALAVAAVLWRSSSESPEAQQYVVLAEKAVAEGNWTQAYEYYGKAMKAGGNRGKLSRAMDRARRKQRQEADQYKVRLQWYRSCIGTGARFAGQRDWERARAAFQQAVDLGATLRPPPGDLGAVQLRLAECEEQLGTDAKPTEPKPGPQPVAAEQPAASAEVSAPATATPPRPQSPPQAVPQRRREKRPSRGNGPNGK